MANLKSILMNTEMVRATLAGRKTSLRRLVKPQPSHFFNCVMGEPRPINGEGYGAVLPDGTEQMFSPPYQTGDLLYVREAWCMATDLFGADPGPVYMADYTESELLDLRSRHFRWKPSVHMPKDIARLFLRVTDVRLEQLQEITEHQAIREGIVRMFDHMTDQQYADWSQNAAPGSQKPDWAWSNYLWHGHFGALGGGNRLSDAWDYQSSGYEDPRASFSSLWNSTIPLKDWPTCGWHANPWVWVIEFERCDKPEGQER